MPIPQCILKSFSSRPEDLANGLAGEGECASCFHPSRVIHLLTSARGVKRVMHSYMCSCGKACVKALISVCMCTCLCRKSSQMDLKCLS